MRNRRPLAAGVLVLCVLSAACGARVNPALRQRAADAVLGSGSTGLPGSSAGSGATTGASGGSALGGLSGAGTGAGSVAGQVAGGTTSGRSGSTGGTTSSGGGATASSGGCSSGGTHDVGLTGNSVLLGNISSESGPVPGLFSGAIEGLNAFVAYINSQGGVCGRTFQVDAADDGLECGRNQSETSDLITKVFAFVGSFSLDDNCGAPVLQQHPDVIDAHVALAPAAGAIPNNFSVEPGPLGYATGMFAYYAQKYGSQVQSVGTLYPNIPSAADKAKAFINSAQSQGWKFTYQRATGATETDWTGDFVKMCHQGNPVRIFFTPAENAANAARMVQDEGQAGCPKLLNIIPIAYDQAFVQSFVNTGGSISSLEGLQGWNEYALFFNPDEAAHIPEIATFQRWFQQTNPGKAVNLYALFAWVEGRLFQQALHAVGAKASRASVMAAIRSIHSFGDDGAVAPVDPGSHTTGATCYVLWQFTGGRFVRVDDPGYGYRCDGRFLPYSG